MKKLIIVPATTLCIIFGAAPATSATPAPQPTVVCDAYSGGCETAPPITDAPTSGETAQTPTGPSTLPHTGITYGEIVLIAAASGLVGFALVGMTRQKA